MQLFERAQVHPSRSPGFSAFALRGLNLIKSSLNECRKSFIPSACSSSHATRLLISRSVVTTLILAVGSAVTLRADVGRGVGVECATKVGGGIGVVVNGISAGRSTSVRWYIIDVGPGIGCGVGRRSSVVDVHLGRSWLKKRRACSKVRDGSIFWP